MWQKQNLPIVALVSVGSSMPVQAHPHVWVLTEATVVYERGSIVGLRQKWTFDEMYSAMTVHDRDANKDGIYDRNELAEPAKELIEGLKHYKFFTHVALAGQEQEFGEAGDYWLEYVEASIAPGAVEVGEQSQSGSPPPAAQDKPGLWEQLRRALFGKSEPPAQAKPKVLSLQFVLPLKTPVLAEAEGFTFSIADPSFFIWFDFVKDNPVRLAGAPDGCAVKVGVSEKDAAELQQLSETFFTQLGGASIGISAGKPVAVVCPK
ncbi:MAG: DUF1007 family protein [Hyphomicrobiaceae bacterium]